MILYIRLAWRNILRNKKRTIIAGVAIGMGLASLIFYDSIVIGMKESMVRTATSSFIGQAQIHGEGFRETHEVELTVVDLGGVIDGLDKSGIVKNYSPRVMSFGMISSAGNSSQIAVYGVDPEKEKHLSKIDEAIFTGDYFSGESKRDVVLGSKLAEQLEVGLEDRIVITLAQAETGDLSQDMFRVSGIYKFGDRNLDGGMAFIRLHMAQEMLNIPGEVHEIAIEFTDIKYAENDTLDFWSHFSEYGNDAVSWTTLFPQLKGAFDMSETAKGIIGFILFAVVALGIINTMLMSIHERIFEFGVLKAIGTAPGRIFILIIFEAVLLSLVSIVIGSIIALALGIILGHTGIDYRGMEFLGTTVQELMYPVLTVDQFIVYPIWVLILTTFVGLYPAAHAARINPSDAMRKSL